MVEKSIELTGTSANSIEDAVNLAVSRAAVTIDNIRHLRVLDITANVADGAVAQWHVKISLSFAIQDRLHE
jgi:dodecin